jgi:DNA-binding transcriptional regulator YhcF (GntR family)
MALLVIDPSSAMPPYEQVRTQIARAIEDGTLGPESQLPTVRRLARELGLAVNTVARAYRELELAGLVETRGRLGTFVAGPPSQRQQLATEAAHDFLRRMAELDIDAAGAVAIARREAERAPRPRRTAAPSTAPSATPNVAPQP